MTRIYTVEEAQSALPELIERALRGDHIVIATGDDLNVSVTLTVQEKSLTPLERPLGTYKGQIYIAPDFDDPLEDFADYM
jgi:antitoxin (DNA-binding transcriptional repressor) of toxin-antitoxin stability system